MSPDELKTLIRSVPDFPAPGVLFRDITTLVAHGPGLRAAVGHLADRARANGAEAIAGMEARGFIFGAAVAARLSLPFLPVRKSGKLPCDTISVDFALEYGSDTLEMDPASVHEGQRVAMVDDLLATGGTACATAKLLRQAGARVEHAFFVINLPDLGGTKKLEDCGVAVAALMEFEGE